MKTINESMKTVKFDNNKAFKPLSVISTLGGTEDSLVSNRIMQVFGEFTANCRNKFINDFMPKTINMLINSIILPKTIKKGRRGKGSELFHDEETDRSENVYCKKNGEDIDAEELSEKLGADTSIGKDEQNPNKEKKNSFAKVLFFIGIRDDGSTNNDTEFLEDV